jgi:hypothetical protein
LVTHARARGLDIESVDQPQPAVDRRRPAKAFVFRVAARQINVDEASKLIASQLTAP